MATIDDVIAALPTSKVLPTVVGNPHYVMRTRLDGRDFILRFIWNQRQDRWYFDILSTAEEPIAVGIKIVANWPLLRFHRWDKRLPPGELMAIDLSGDRSPPRLNELAIGKRCELTYFPVTDL